MENKIDLVFLSNLEGGCKVNGYVPAASVSKSGVTIATGFDLGQRSETDLKNLKLNPSLIKKLATYLGKKSKEASDVLKKQSLVLSLDEATSIDKAVKSEHIKKLQLKYKNASTNKENIELFSLPAEAQTVIASVTFQYGINLDIAAPKFWIAVTTQNWKEAMDLLNNFGDAYPTRRKTEAKLLEGLVNAK